MKLLEFGLRHREDRNPFIRIVGRIILTAFRKWADKEETKIGQGEDRIMGSQKDINRMLQYIEKEQGIYKH